MSDRPSGSRTVAEVMSTQLATVTSDPTVGIVSLGDLAQEDESSDDAGIALTDISVASADQ